MAAVSEVVVHSDFDVSDSNDYSNPPVNHVPTVKHTSQMAHPQAQPLAPRLCFQIKVAWSRQAVQECCALQTSEVRMMENTIFRAGY